MPFTPVTVADDGISPVGSNVWNNLITHVVEVVDTDRSYYVRSDGSDSNDGLSNTASGAWLTIQHAFDVIALLRPTDGKRIDLNIGAGEFQGGILWGHFGGGGFLRIIGQGTGSTNITQNVTAGGGEGGYFNFQGPFGESIQIKGGFNFKGSTYSGGTSGYYIDVNFYCRCVIDCSLSCDGDAADTFIYCEVFSIVEWLGGGGRTMTINGPLNTPIYAVIYASVGIVAALVVNNTPAWGAQFVTLDDHSAFNSHFIGGVTGTATGKRFTVTGRSRIGSFTGSLTEYPGDTAGTLSGDSSFNDYKGDIRFLSGEGICGSDGTLVATFDTDTGITGVNYWEFVNDENLGSPEIRIKGGTLGGMQFKVLGDPSAAVGFSIGGGAGAQFSITGTQAGTVGPVINVVQDSTSPAAGDSIGTFQFGGKDTHTPFGNTVAYGSMLVRIIDPSTPSRAGEYIFRTMAADTQSVTQTQIGSGVILGATGPAYPGRGCLRSSTDGFLQTGAVAVSALPAASTANAGARMVVTDATTITFATTVVGGSTYAVPVYSDGVAWRIG